MGGGKGGGCGPWVPGLNGRRRWMLGPLVLELERVVLLQGDVGKRDARSDGVL